MICDEPNAHDEAAARELMLGEELPPEDLWTDDDREHFRRLSGAFARHRAMAYRAGVRHAIAWRDAELRPGLRPEARVADAAGARAGVLEDLFIDGNAGIAWAVVRWDGEPRGMLVDPEALRWPRFSIDKTQDA